MYKERDLLIVSPSCEYLSECRYGQLRLAPSVCVCVQYVCGLTSLGTNLCCAAHCVLLYCTVLFL